MSRSFKDFQDYMPTDPGNLRKNLRNNAREARDYFSGDGPKSYRRSTRADFSDDKPSIDTYSSVGHGVSGESSN
jgi:hypothetical protein